jgi:hypothetical protein
MILEDFESLGAKQTKIKVLQTTFGSLLLDHQETIRRGFTVEK